jgi:replicative DNA helicase
MKAGEQVNDQSEYKPNKKQMLDHLIALHGVNPQGYIAVAQYDDKGYPIQDIVKVDGIEGLKHVVLKSLEMQERKPHRNTYYSVCMFKTDDSREAINVQTIPGFWLDLDTRTGTHKETLLPATQQEALQILKQIIPKKPSIAINSQGGLHVYYLLYDRYTPQNKADFEYINKLMKAFRSAFKEAYLNKGYKGADSVCQPAGVMRLPGMLNRKYNKEVEIIYGDGPRYTLAEIEAITAQMKQISGTAIDQDTDTPKQDPLDKQGEIKADKHPEVIYAECNFIKHWCDNAADLPEPEWYAGITILAPDDVIGGREYIHKQSAKYPGYTYSETEAKIKHAKKAGPRTCKAIAQDTANEYCRTCRHRDSHIGTPTTLGNNTTINEEFSIIDDDPQETKTAEEEAEALIKFQMSQSAYLNNSAGHYAEDEFDKNIKSNADLNAIPTGFPALDHELEGGLYPSLYFIGAISSLGKTSFCIQLGDQVAQAGHDVLIFSLEQSKDELIAKSISRITYNLDTSPKKWNAKTVTGILNGKRYANYNETEHGIITEATRQYSEYAKGRIFIREGVGNIGVKQISESVEQHIKYTGRRPLVILDYLQILAPHDARSTDKQNTDKNVTELKRISRDHKICIIGISSFNRDNYNQSVSMSAFKESGAIEYSSDVLIGLQFKGTGEQDFDVDKAKSEDMRELELKILKNRNGRAGRVIEFENYPMFNVFHEIGLQAPKPPKERKGQRRNSGRSSLIDNTAMKPDDIYEFLK